MRNLSRRLINVAVAALDHLVDLLPEPATEGPWSDFGIDWGHVGTDDMWETWTEEMDLCQRARA